MATLHLLAQPRVHQARHVRRVGHDLGQALAEFLRGTLRAVALHQDAFQHRLGHGPDVDLRVQLAAHAFDVEQGLLQQDQLRLQGQFVALRGAEQLGQHLGQRDLAERAGEVRLAHRACGGFQFVDADVRGHPAGLHVQLGDAAVVAVEDRHEVLGEPVLVVARELAHDAEIQRDEARIGLAFRIHPDVAGVRIGVEEVVAEHLLVEHAHALGGERLAVDAGRVQRGDVVRRDAAHALHRHRALRRVRPDHFRHVQIGRPGPVAAQQAGIAGLALQVEFGGQRVLDLGHDLARADLVRVGMRAFDDGGDALQQRDVAGDLAADVRAQHLHHHLAPARQRGGVHLRDAGRRQRRGVEGLEGVADVARELLLDPRTRALAVERRHPVLQQGQLFGDVGRDQVAPGGQDLAELHEDRAQFLQRQPQARTPRLCGDLGRCARHEGTGQLQPALDRRAFQQVVQAIAQ